MKKNYRFLKKTSLCDKIAKNITLDGLTEASKVRNENFA